MDVRQGPPPSYDEVMNASAVAPTFVREYSPDRLRETSPGRLRDQVHQSRTQCSVLSCCILGAPFCVDGCTHTYTCVCAVSICAHTGSCVCVWACSFGKSYSLLVDPQCCFVSWERLTVSCSLSIAVCLSVCVCMCALFSVCINIMDMCVLVPHTPKEHLEKERADRMDIIHAREDQQMREKVCVPYSLTIL